MAFSKVVALIALFSVAANAQVLVPGNCPNVTVEQDFDIQAYLGRWYQYQSYFAAFEPNGKCNSATYSDNLNGTIGVRNYLVDQSTGAVDTVLGYAFPNNDNNDGRLKVVFPNEASGEAGGDYWVLDTDYDSYTVIWSCTNFGQENSIQLSWVLTRERVPSSETLAAAEDVIAQNGLSDNYIVTSQEDCPPDDQE